MTEEKRGPISPDEVASHVVKNFPQIVFEAFNELISAKFVGRSAKVMQDEVIALILEKDATTGTGEFTRKMIFEKGWLNVERAYEEQGWRVEYDKPGYNEFYEASFTFSKK